MAGLLGLRLLGLSEGGCCTHVRDFSSLTDIDTSTSLVFFFFFY